MHIRIYQMIHSHLSPLKVTIEDYSLTKQQIPPNFYF